MDEKRLQEQGAKLVNVHVYHCLSYLMGELLKAPEFTCKAFEVDYETLYNMQAIPHYDEALASYLDDLSFEERQEKLHELGDLYDVDLAQLSGSDAVCFLTEAQQTEAAQNYNLDPDYYDVFEYWAISDWLSDKFRAKGELVVELADFNVWCRCTTGQAIYLDGVVRNLIKELGW